VDGKTTSNNSSQKSGRRIIGKTPDHRGREVSPHAPGAGKRSVSSDRGYRTKAEVGAYYQFELKIVRGGKPGRSKRRQGGFLPALEQERRKKKPGVKDIDGNKEERREIKSAWVS